MTYNPSSFLIFDQGMVGSFRRFRTSSRSQPHRLFATVHDDAFAVIRRSV